MSLSRCFLFSDVLSKVDTSPINDDSCPRRLRQLLAYYLSTEDT